MASSLQQYYKKAFQDYLGGMNTTDSALVVKPNQFTQLDNYVMADRSILEKCEGYSLDGTPFPDDPDSFIRMLVNYKRGSTVDKLIVAALDEGNANASYKVDVKETSGDGTYSYIGYATGTATFTSGSANVTSGTGTAFTVNLKAGDKIKPTGTSVWYEVSAPTGAGTLTLTGNFGEATQTDSTFLARIMWHKDYIPRGIVFNDNFVMTNGSEAMASYNNTTVTIISDVDAPKCKFIEPHKSRVFVANTPGAPSNIYWSAVNDETSWDAAAFEPVFPKDGSNICAIKSYADSLIVFKENGKIYQVVGDFSQDSVGEPNFIIKIDTPENIGTLAGYTPVIGDDNRLYFLTETGFYALDRNLQIAKISWNIQNTVDDIVIRPGISSAKSFFYDSKAQFDTGSYVGSKTSALGVLSPVFDLYTQTDATKRAECLSMDMDSDTNLHIAYLDSANPLKITYCKVAADGTITTETAVTSATAIYALSIAVASNGTVGIAYTVGDASSTVTAALFNGGALAEQITNSQNYGIGVFNGAFTSKVFPEIVERVSGTWGAKVSLPDAPTPTGLALVTNGTSAIEGIVVMATAYSKIKSVSLVYNSSNNPRILICGAQATTQFTFGSDGDGQNPIAYNEYTNHHEVAIYNLRGSSVWSSKALFQSLYAFPNNMYLAADAAGAATPLNSSMLLTSNNPRLCFTHGGNIRVYSSANDGTSWTNTENFTTGVLGRIQLQLNASGNLITGYVDSSAGTFKKRNHTTTTTTTLDSNTASYGIGYNVSATVSADQDYTYSIAGSSPTAAEKSIFQSSSSITNSTVNVIDKSVLVGDRCMLNSGRIFGMCAFGTSSNSVVIRRFAYTSEYKTAETSDSTLTSWSTANMVNSLNNGTITYTAALDTSDQGSDPLTTALYTTTLLDSTIISTDASKVFISARILIVLGDFLAPTIDSLTLNYTGAGVGALMPTGVCFNNELYFSYGTSSDTENSRTLLFDKNKAFSRLSYPVLFMERYKNTLYAGLAATGKVVKLRKTFGKIGVAYTATAITKEDLLGSIEQEKSVSKIYIIYETKASGTFTFAYRLNSFQSVSGSDWTTTTINQTTTSDTPGFAEVEVGNKCRSIQFKIENANLDNEMSLIGFVVKFTYLNDR